MNEVERDLDLKDEVQVVAFRLGDEEYAVNILAVQEIIRVLHITRVPRAHVYIEGVINLRGNVIPIINLHKKFGLRQSENNEDARIIVFHVDDVKAGFIVDGVSEVLRLTVDEIEATGQVYGQLDGNVIKGIGKVDGRLIILLDPVKLMDL